MRTRTYTAKEQRAALAEIAATSVAAVARARGIPKSTLKTWKVAAVGVTRRVVVDSIVELVRDERQITTRGVAIALGIEISTARKHLRRAERLQAIVRSAGRVPWFTPTVRQWKRTA